MTKYDFEDTIIGESLPEMVTPIHCLSVSMHNPLLRANYIMETQHLPISDYRISESCAPVTMVSSAECTSLGNEPRLQDLCERVLSMDMTDCDISHILAGHTCTTAVNGPSRMCSDNKRCSSEVKHGMQVDEFLVRNDDAVAQNGDINWRLDVDKTYSRDNDGDTILHIAIIIRELEIAMHIIDMTPAIEFLNISNALFQTPLHLAVLTNQLPLVRRLIVGGATVESRDKDGNTSLHIACRDARVESVKILLEHVTYVETKQNLYEIPYQRIPQNLDLSNYEGATCLHIAAASDFMHIVNILIDKGANVNAKESKRGHTILHVACWSGNIRLVKYLLRCKDCNINSRTFDGYTPFDVARSRNNWDVCMELASAGAKYRADESDE